MVGAASGTIDTEGPRDLCAFSLNVDVDVESKNSWCRTAPIEDLTLIDLQCNGESSTNYFTEPAALVGPVAAGDTVQLTWINYAGDSHKGPLITYMARAPSDVDIRKWMPGKEAVWFKVHHEGKSEDGKWAATETFEKKNGTYTFRIPPNLLPGQYLIRHEWIALHFAEQYPGAQLYPVCVQVEVTGNGAAFPTSFVSFPGAYTADTQGIIYDVWNDIAVRILNYSSQWPV
ncbi:hypothetical protein EST38_g420 [Candolleomyces aberdarensis]|uniref:lytic cellulose monooxygenase (C4-dehydrogenating) n=1 Tax=Candolleomyces aberdarensis TaxID=2316362 RepID=A0A4Q2DY32_9AGAR|nr:hypothetical protein EST38_g420 [Candolleomyces aberdarensis]